MPARGPGVRTGRPLVSFGPGSNFARGRQAGLVYSPSGGHLPLLTRAGPSIERTIRHDGRPIAPVRAGLVSDARPSPGGGWAWRSSGSTGAGPTSAARCPASSWRPWWGPAGPSPPPGPGGPARRRGGRPQGSGPYPRRPRPPPAVEAALPAPAPEPSPAGPNGPPAGTRAAPPKRARAVAGKGVVIVGQDG